MLSRYATLLCTPCFLRGRHLPWGGSSTFCSLDAVPDLTTEVYPVLHPILEGDSWEESQALLQILLQHFCPQSTQSQDCLVWFSLDISFSSVRAFSTVKCTQSLPLLKIYVSKMKMTSSVSLPSTSAFCHGWWDEHFPSSPLRGWVDLSYCVGFSLSIHTCGLLQKYTLLQVLNDDECFRSSWGWIKSNR